MAKKTLAEMLVQQEALQKEIEKNLAELAEKIGRKILKDYPEIQSISAFDKFYKSQKEELKRLKKLEEEQAEKAKTYFPETEIDEQTKEDEKLSHLGKSLDDVESESSSIEW